MHASDIGILALGLLGGSSLGWWWRGQRALTAMQTPVHPVAEANPNLTIADPSTLALRSLLHQAPIGYIQVDDENQLMWCNSTASRLLGIAYGNQEPSDTPRLLLEWVRSYELDHLIEQTRQTQTPQQEEWTLNLVSPDPLHPNEGVSYPLRGYSIPLVAGQVGVFLENRQEAVTLMQQRDRWTSDVAHELKTPLTSIRLVAETLRSRVDVDTQSWVDRLLNEILRLSNLVEDLLNLSRLESGGGTGLNLKPTELPQLIFSAWYSLEPLAQVKRLELEYQGPSELTIAIDEALIHRVLINLMDNAIKYSPAETLIKVCVSQSNELTDTRTGSSGVHIEVIDQGAGFKEVDLPYIFSRFYRADPARSRISLLNFPPETEGRGSNGTGLGLAIVQQIVDAHCGYVTARNHPDTGGGWLTLTLPLTTPAPLLR